MTELLSPAGGREALAAAVQNGADAVYMGFGSFNARRSARNFSDEEFLAAVRYCHLRGVKVYLTLNTLVTDRELPALAETARRASEYGVDAILVQDWGVYETLRVVIPDVPLHASTQMALHTLSGVEEAARLGMTRAVLARELSGEEIREIAERAPIEIETFAHGALCMCYSGMCEMSAVIGGRSGNRGACAQPCRLRYGWHGKADANPLSLKDANLAAYAGEMTEMGVACLKLEGRMKRPEYVAAVTGIYAALLREHRAPTADEQKKLALAFSRDGFTDGYYRGRRGKEMFGVRPETARWPEEWFGTLRAAYEKEDMRLVPVRFRAALRLGEPMVLTAEDGDGHCVTATGAAPEAARSRAVTAGEVEARLRKTGGTAFTVSDCAVTAEDGLSVLASALNALRREALSELLDARGAAKPWPRSDAPAPAAPEKRDRSRTGALWARFAELSQIPAGESFDKILLPVERITPEIIETFGERLIGVLPAILWPADEEALEARLAALKEAGLREVYGDNIYAIPLTRRRGLTLHGGAGLNILNTEALRHYEEEGLASVTASFELSMRGIKSLGGSIPLGAIVYGRLPLMHFRNCPLRAQIGCAACRARGELTDRRGVKFPVECGEKKYSTLLNSVPLHIADKDLRGLDHCILWFTRESAAECAAVAADYRAGRKSERERTGGLYYRELL